MAFDVGAIVAHLTLDNKQWNTAVERVQKQQSEFTKKIQANSAKIKSFGRAMTIAGVAIVAGFGKMTKEAINANEVFSKFGVVFQDVIGGANKQVKNLTENYGLSSIESKKLLSDTGDLLTGFGFTQKAALDLSKRVSELGVDLASFTNIEGGAEQAVRALSSAMLGETERAKALGIVIRQDSKEFINLVARFQESEGMTLLQAKAMAALTIATKQSKNAIGDFNRTQHSAANQARILQARFQDLIIDIGEKLVPIAQKLITGIQKIVKRVSDWIKENPALSAAIIKVTLTIGALMAVLGPFLLILPQIASGIGLVMGALSAVNPVILIGVAAITALKVAFSVLKTAQIAAMKAIVETNDALVSSIQTVREFAKVANAEDQAFIKRARERFKAMGKTRTETEILIEKLLNRRSKNFRAFSQERNKQEKELTDEEKRQIAARALAAEEARKKAAEAAKKAMADRKKELEANNQILAEQMEGFEALTLFQIEQQQELEKFKEEQDLKRQINEATGLQKSLLILRQKQLAEKAAIETQFADKTMANEALLELEKAHQEERQKIINDFNEKNKKTIWDHANAFLSAANFINSIVQNASQARMNQLDNEFEERKTWIEENIADETEREKALEALEDEFTAKKKDAARKSAIADKAVAIMGAVVNTAQAVTKAFAQGGIFGFATAAIMAAAGAAQIAVIKSQPIPLQQGGITQGATPAVVGDNPSGTEAIIPLERFDEIFGQQGQSMQITINAMDGMSVKRVFQNEIISMIQDATKTENLLIAPNAVRAF
jgi:hypothetical protein